MRATGRSRTGRSRARDGPASAAQAASRRRRGRSERRRPGQRRCPAAPARSWRGEGSGTRRQAATRQIRPSVSAFGERPRFDSALAAQTFIQSVRLAPLASRRVAGKQSRCGADDGLIKYLHLQWPAPLRGTGLYASTHGASLSAPVSARKGHTIPHALSRLRRTPIKRLPTPVLLRASPSRASNEIDSDRGSLAVRAEAQQQLHLAINKKERKTRHERHRQRQPRTAPHSPTPVCLGADHLYARRTRRMPARIPVAVSGPACRRRLGLCVQGGRRARGVGAFTSVAAVWRL